MRRFGIPGALAFSPGRNGAAGDHFFHLGASAFFTFHQSRGRNGTQKFFKNKAAFLAFIIIDRHFASPQEDILAQF
jgi:hypothetical protein